ncbi:MAG: SIMPL domain-containing protein [Anaerolineales bacterium]
MKQFSTVINTALTCTLIFILVSIGLPSLNVRASAASTPQPTEVTVQSVCDPARAIHVTGTAVVNVKPDRALIQLGVQSNGKTASEVQIRNSATINQVVKALSKLGIESKDITTDWYTIEPIYEDYDYLRIKGYRIHNIIQITMRDVDKTNEAIVTAFTAGANEVENVEFYTSELRKYRDQAREMAMNAAMEKAKALATTAGTDTSCVLDINENSWSYFNQWSWWYGRNQNQNLWTQNAVQNIAPSEGSETPTIEDGPVSAGQISIRAEVNASFGLK